MKVKEYFHNVECDCCHKLADDECWHVDESIAREQSSNNGWKRFGDVDYCPDCYTEDEDTGIIKTKDGKWYNGCTGNELTEEFVKDYYYGEIPDCFRNGLNEN
jgi:hypothetical protein